MTDQQILDYINRSLPVAFATLGVNVTHEIGHSIAAAIHKASLRALRTPGWPGTGGRNPPWPTNSAPLAP